MAGRQAAKIRCRKCEYLIQIAYRGDGEEFDVTATPPTAPPPAGAARVSKGGAVGQPAAVAAARSRASLDEGVGSKKPTAAVPGLPGLGSAKSTRGAALVSEGTSRRPLAPLPPPPVAPGGSLGGASVVTSAPAPGGSSAPGLGGAPSDAAPRSSSANGVSSAPIPTPPRGSGSTQLGDQFRESVQAGAIDDLPREGWFVGVNGVPLGPIPLGDLRELAIAGHIDRRSLVWREGQAEWRPLGKFPGLVRAIDDGVGPPSPVPDASGSASSASPPAPPAPAFLMNGSGGQTETGTHIVTGFDVVRPDLSERPSAWGDLDDDDDDDEQPTTVKGRVSVMPASMQGSMPASMPASMPTGSSAAPPSVAQGLPQAAPPPAPRGNTTSVAAAFGASAPAPSPSGLAPTAFDGLPDLDAPPPRSSRTRWYLIAAAIVVAFALGAVVTHLMRSSAAEKPAPGAGPGRSSLVFSPFVPGAPARAVASEPSAAQRESLGC